MEVAISLRPLDLQNLFVHLNLISREQAARQSAPLHVQQTAADENVKETRQADEKVHTTEKISEGSEKIHDEEGHAQDQDERTRHEKDDNNSTNLGDDPFKDSALGNTIDIIG